MPVGRPTTYRGKKTIKLVDEYLNNRKDKWDEEKQKWVVDLPTMGGLAVFIGCNVDSLYEWEKKHPEFSESLDKVRQEQQDRLINKGLSGDYNSTIAKLILSSNHGMRERTDVTTDDKELPNPIYGGQAVSIPGHNSDAKDFPVEKED